MSQIQLIRKKVHGIPAGAYMEIVDRDRIGYYCIIVNSKNYERLTPTDCFFVSKHNAAPVKYTAIRVTEAQMNVVVNNICDTGVVYLNYNISLVLFNDDFTLDKEDRRILKLYTKERHIYIKVNMIQAVLRNNVPSFRISYAKLLC